jgi:peptidoglycan/LPS O-acetylase OafA/YrhL
MTQLPPAAALPERPSRHRAESPFGKLADFHVGLVRAVGAMTRWSAIRLGDYTAGRDNNIQLLRLLSAASVIAFHSYAFTGHMENDPVWRATSDTNFGALGVRCFFVLSGFLVTQSWLRHPRLPAFLAARVLRIYPALFAAVALTILLAGLSSPLPWSRFLFDPITIDYAWRNALAWQVRFDLPGAFATNPFPGGSNGSLWTLPIELRLYVGVAIAGIAGILVRRNLCAAVFVALVALFALKPEWLPLEPNDPGVPELALLFGLGSLAYVWRSTLPLSLAATVAAILFYAWNPLGFGRGPVATLILCYLVLVLAYHPWLKWRAFNRIGDYSYGLYVFAFPVQQTIVFRMPSLTPGELFAFSFLATLVLAVASWHVLEKPALRLRSRFRDRASRT